EPIYQRTRELLAQKEQLEKIAEDSRKELKSRMGRSMNTPTRLTSPIHG
ncbi:hypothetical protein GE061_011920, partial [Apolygus lucorum]